MKKFIFIFLFLLIPSICFSWGEVTRPQLNSASPGFGADMVKGSTKQVATIADLEALPIPSYAKAVYLQERGGGVFIFDSSDLSANVTADTHQGIYIAPTSDATGASGAWVRQYNGIFNVL